MTYIITSQGGFAQPTIGSGGFVQGPSGVNFYQGMSMINNIPEFARGYALARASLYTIREGKSALSRIMYDQVRRKGLYTVDDVRFDYPIKIVPHQRFYLKATTNQGGTTGSSAETGQFMLKNLNDCKRLQPTDLILLMFTETDMLRTNTNSSICDYTAASGGSEYTITRDVTKAQPEICEITNVNYSTGIIDVIRNKGGDSRNSTTDGSESSTTYGGPGVTVVADSSTNADPGANAIYEKDAFFVKMLNSIPETIDDQMIYALSTTLEYNYIQRVMRKWGSNDMEEKVNKRYTDMGMPSTLAKNMGDAVDGFWNELDWLLMYGFRNAKYVDDNKYQGFMGGMLETIPENNKHVLYAPNYTAYSTKPGSFNIPYFNYVMEDKGYYGSDEKILFCGADTHTAFTMMINYMTQAVPDIRNEWSVRGKRFYTSNGLILNVVNSETMTLNGHRDKALLLDLDTFQMAALGEDVKIVPKLPLTNIHMNSGEIFGDLSLKRQNPMANHLFIIKPNNQS